MATLAELEKQYSAAQAAMPTLAQERTRISGELGLGQRRQSLDTLRKSVLDTEKLLEEVPQNVQSRARRLGGPVTAAALNRLTSARQQPISAQLGQLGRQQAAEQEGLNLGLQELQSQLGIVGQQQQQSREDWLRRLGYAREEDVAQRNAQIQRDLAAQQAAFNRQQMAYQNQLAMNQMEAQRQAEIRKAQGLMDMYKQYGLNPDGSRPTPTPTNSNLLIETGNENQAGTLAGTLGDIASIFTTNPLQKLLNPSGMTKQQIDRQAILSGTVTPFWPGVKKQDPELYQWAVQQGLVK